MRKGPVFPRDTAIGGGRSATARRDLAIVGEALRLLEARRVISSDQVARATEVLEERAGRQFGGEVVALGGPGRYWVRRTPGLLVLVDDQGNGLGTIEIVRATSRFRWRVYWPRGSSQRAVVMEAGYTLNAYDAMFEVEGGVDVPIKVGEAAPGFDYDPSRLPVGPLKVRVDSNSKV